MSHEHHSSSRAILFLSHVNEEREIALEFKEVIESAFFGLIDVFVAASPKSVPPGKRWLDEITYSLGNCKIEVILCSPASVGRPWINFEAGSGWIRDIPVIPLCYGGMAPSQLPAPLKELQGVSATDEGGLCNLIPQFAKAIGAPREPQVQFHRFASYVRAFEQRQEEAEYDIYEEMSHGDSGEPDPEVEKNREELFSTISGRWRLEYAAGKKNRAGKESLSIDHLGKYWIIHEITGCLTHHFDLHPLHVDDELEHIKIAKVRAKNGQLWQNEILTISTDGSRMEGHAESDGHRIVYVRF